jgi:hypothetical protein
LEVAHLWDALPSVGISGEFFNDGTSSTPGDRSGDVFASIEGFPETVFDDYAQVWADVIKCLNSSCGTYTSLFHTYLFYQSPNSVGPHFSQPSNFSLGWDGATTFTFIWNGLTPVTYDTATNGVFNVALANQPFRQLDVRPLSEVFILVGGPVTIAASFDNVTTQSGLYDAFSTATLDDTKWRTSDSQPNINVGLELVRDVSGGKLRSKLRQYDSTQSNNLSVTNPGNYRSAAADVTVKTYTVTGAASANMNAGIGITGYNDGTAGAVAGSNIGDIFGTISMSDTAAQYSVARCTTANCSSLANISGTGTDGLVPIKSVTLGSTHTLYVDWNPSAHVFTFQLDSDPPVVYDPIANGAPVASALPNLPFLNLRTRANLANGDTGLIDAVFDNAKVGDR